MSGWSGRTDDDYIRELCFFFSCFSEEKYMAEMLYYLLNTYLVETIIYKGINGANMKSIKSLPAWSITTTIHITLIKLYMIMIKDHYTSAVRPRNDDTNCFK